MATIVTPLTGLKDIQGNLIPADKAPNINVGVFFNTSPDAKGSTPVPITCDEIIGAAKQLTLQNFLQNYKIFDSTTDPSQRQNDMKTNLSLFRDGLVISSIDQLQTIQSSTLPSIQNYLNTIQTSQIPVLRQVQQCLQETTIPDTQELIQQRNTTSESKLRLDTIKNIDTNVSYYEGWFPMFRPMNESSLFGLFAASMLLLLVSTAVFLNMAGVSLDIKFPSFGIESDNVTYTPYILMGIGLSATVGLLRWYFQ